MKTKFYSFDGCVELHVESLTVYVDFITNLVACLNHPYITHLIHVCV